VKDYGGCAIYGCESKKARAVSVGGYVTRLMRLFVAALLFPPRVVKTLGVDPDRRFRSAWRSSVASATVFPDFLARGVRPLRRWRGGPAARDEILPVVFVACLSLLAFFPAVLVACRLDPQYAAYAAIEARNSAQGLRTPMMFWPDPGAIAFKSLLLWVAFAVLIVIALRIVSFLVVFLLALCFYASGAARLTLKSEFAALARADNPESTVLGRLRRGSGEKK
jgi:hypothetical protein